MATLAASAAAGDQERESTVVQVCYVCSSSLQQSVLAVHSALQHATELYGAAIGLRY
jgi:hypothetical protein